MVRRYFSQDEPPVSGELLRTVQARSQPLHTPADLDPVLERIGDARFVLLGEASHGTAEYYTWRAEISKRLIVEKGFTLLAVEGDWPDCYQVNRYIRGLPGSGDTAQEVLHAFQRWPTWMWANREMVPFVNWLRRHNENLPAVRRVGFYGLDVYSLWDSLYQVLGYLRQHDPVALPVARRAFACFEPYGEDAREYAQATRWVGASCEDEVIALLSEVRQGGRHYPDDGREAHFNAEQNALVVKNADGYYRSMVRGGPDSWNVRDRHMAETLDRLLRHHGPSAKAIIWAHNTHSGDARFTDMAAAGMVNVGQLVREQHPGAGVLIGFGSHRGGVIAGREWDAPPVRMGVPPARSRSWEDVLHQAGPPASLILFAEEDGDGILARPRGHRAIGVVYHPDREQYGNYVPTVLPRRYDAFIFLDKTEALQPLHVQPRHEEVPETYPSGV